jgi:hypothetical protein
METKWESNNGIGDTEFAHQRHVSVKQAIANRKRHLSNIWVFDSPKNNRRFVILGDVAFMHTVLMEGNRAIAGYDVNPPPVSTVIDGETRQTTLDAVVQLVSGGTEWHEFKRFSDTGPSRSGRAKPQLSAQAQCASLSGVKYRVLTEVDLQHKQILFDNWLLLCAAITRARGQTIFRETQVLRERIASHRSITLGGLMNDPAVDPGLMLAVVATALQQGRIHTDLDNILLSSKSVLEGGTQ